MEVETYYDELPIHFHREGSHNTSFELGGQILTVFIMGRCVKKNNGRCCPIVSLSLFAREITSAISVKHRSGSITELSSIKSTNNNAKQKQNVLYFLPKNFEYLYTNTVDVLSTIVSTSEMNGKASVSRVAALPPTIQTSIHGKPRPAAKRQTRAPPNITDRYTTIPVSSRRNDVVIPRYLQMFVAALLSLSH